MYQYWGDKCPVQFHFFLVDMLLVFQSLVNMPNIADARPILRFMFLVHCPYSFIIQLQIILPHFIFPLLFVTLELHWIKSLPSLHIFTDSVVIHTTSYVSSAQVFARLFRMPPT